MKTRHSPAVAMAYGLTFREDKFDMNPGDCIYLYTDGVTEAMDTERNLYGTDRMLKALDDHSAEQTGELLASMKREVESFVKDAPQFDDITMLALHYYGGRGNPAGESWEITVEAKTENLTALFDFLKEHLDERGCSSRSQSQIKLAAEEIFVNVANYAYNPDIGPVTIRLDVKDDTASITFIDRGVPYDPLAKPDPDVTLPAVERTIGGLGIYMAKKSMDSFFYEYKDGQNVLHMQKRL